MEPMVLHKVGPDELSDYDWDGINNVEWAVYAYEIGSWEGSGIMFYKLKDGNYGVENLGHCSCYGPLDAATLTGTPDWREILEKEVKPVSKDDYDYHLAQAVYDKVLEIMGG